MKSKILSPLCILSVILCMGCKKFLDVLPDTATVNPSTVADFEEMINHEDLSKCSFYMADLMSDDAYFEKNIEKDYYANAYFWRDNIWTAGEDDKTYNKAYEIILQLNIILSKLPTITVNNPSEESTRSVLLAQAKIHRAWFYLQLANVYGTDYTAGSVDKNPAVPLVLDPGQTEKKGRATVKEVYTQILKDLNDAVATAELPEMGKSVIHPGRASALGLLARTYLYMGDYANAEKNATAALAIRDTLLNFKEIKYYPLSLLDQAESPEVYLAKSGEDVDYYVIHRKAIDADPMFLATFSWDDLRKERAFGYGKTFVNRSGKMTFNYGIGVPEMLFIQAECLARKNQTPAALNILNRIQRARMEGPSDLTATNEEILPLVFAERRKELFFHGGLRLFDQKRMNRDPKLRKTVKRVLYDDWSDEVVEEYATLEPNSPRYLMQIAPKIIAINPLIVPNPR